MFSKSYVGVRGKISDEEGKETAVTFSLYPNYDVLGMEWHDGLCRVSDGSDALRDLFDSGNLVRLSSGELDVSILLTSTGTFRVIDSVATAIIIS